MDNIRSANPFMNAMKYLTCVLLTISLFCCANSDRYEFTEIPTEPVASYHSEFANFCNLNTTDGNHERNAVTASFVGAVAIGLEQAALNNRSSHTPRQISATERAKLAAELRFIANDTTLNEAEKILAENLLSAFGGEGSAADRIAAAEPVPAANYIAERAGDYHFTLINEAHYSSQHRQFTERLLQKLWERGYRYLALETFAHEDSNLVNRGYPIVGTGYYTRDHALGNVVRTALAIGFTPIAYESRSGNEGTARDYNQAKNILDQTLSRDSSGKVLIHAGYSHINEIGDSRYEPLGAQLKKMTGQDLLTIDQIGMTPLPSLPTPHPNYLVADSLFDWDEPIVLLNDDHQPIVDPLLGMGFVDIQVYHPVTRFVTGRPHWAKTAEKYAVPLDRNLRQFAGHLVRAIPAGEPSDAIPVDQFVIDTERLLLLPRGDYRIEIIDCTGTLVRQYRLTV